MPASSPAATRDQDHAERGPRAEVEGTRCRLRGRRGRADATPGDEDEEQDEDERERDRDRVVQGDRALRAEGLDERDHHRGRVDERVADERAERGEVEEGRTAPFVPRAHRRQDRREGHEGRDAAGERDCEQVAEQARGRHRVADEAADVRDDPVDPALGLEHLRDHRAREDDDPEGREDPPDAAHDPVHGLLEAEPGEEAEEEGAADEREERRDPVAVARDRDEDEHEHEDGEEPRGVHGIRTVGAPVG